MQYAGTESKGYYGGWFCLGFFLGVIGLFIGRLMKNDANDPEKALKSVVDGFLYSILASAIFFGVIFFFIMVALMSAAAGGF